MNTACTSPTVSTIAARARAQRLRARGEPGMAMLLVLMLIVMVTAVGVFASQSSALEVQSSGFVRQSAQTHYVAQSGVVTAMDELRRNCRMYRTQMVTTAATAAVPAGQPEAPLTYRFYGNYLNQLMLTSNVFATPAAFGRGGLSPGFFTDATLLYEVPNTLAGFDVNGSVVHVYTFDLSANGQTRLANVTDARNNTLGVEAARALASVPCI
jgi:hypothetical protein